MYDEAFIIRELYLSAEPNSDLGDNPGNFNTDVIVVIQDEENDFSTTKYVASFFTYSNILGLRSQFAKSGEYLNGKYFYAKNMVLIDHCTLENIRAVVNHIVEEGEFGEVFRKI